MNPRPFYRSRLFWLGLPGLVFLLWGWEISIEYYSHIHFGGSHHWVIGQSWGVVFAMSDPSGWPDWRNIDSEHAKISGVDDFLGVRSNAASWGERYPTLPMIFIPYYWPVLAYTAT